MPFPPSKCTSGRWMTESPENSDSASVASRRCAVTSSLLINALVWCICRTRRAGTVSKSLLQMAQTSKKQLFLLPMGLRLSTWSRNTHHVPKNRQVPRKKGVLHGFKRPRQRRLPFEGLVLLCHGAFGSQVASPCGPGTIKRRGWWIPEHTAWKELLREMRLSVYCASELCPLVSELKTRGHFLVCHSVHVERTLIEESRHLTSATAQW